MNDIEDEFNVNFNEEHKRTDSSLDDSETLSLRSSTTEKSTNSIELSEEIHSQPLANQTKISEQASLKDFQILKLLGQGSYGKVLLVKKTTELNELYAMKVLSKAEIAERQIVSNTKTERNILATVSHPNIVKLNSAFQTAQRLYLVLEYCPGILQTICYIC